MLLSDIQLGQTLSQVQSIAVNSLHRERSSGPLVLLDFRSSDHELKTWTAELSLPNNMLSAQQYFHFIAELLIHFYVDSTFAE